MATCYVNIAEMVDFSGMHLQLYECISDLSKEDLVKDNISLCLTALSLLAMV